MKNIGFIGVGHMGHPIVQNLLKAQYDVMVFDQRRGAIAALVAVGAREAPELTDIANFADTIFIMVQTGEQVYEICQTLFPRVAPNTLFIDCSSIDVGTCRLLHSEAREKNLLFLDAPVSGGVVGAEAATLTIMVGGEEPHYEKALPILEHIGKKIIFAGAAGNGQVAKICNNMLLGISMIGVCEAINLGKQLGLSSEKFFSITSEASGQCWSLTSYCPEPNLVPNVPANHNYEPGFAAPMMLKDLNLSQMAARSQGVSTPLGAAATQLYQLFVNQGGDTKDFSGIINFLKKEYVSD